MARRGRVRVAVLVVGGLAAACEVLIGADFGSYESTPNGNGGGTGGGGASPTGGDAGDPPGGNAGVAGSTTTGGTAGSSGAATGGGGGEPSGGSSSGGVGGSAGTQAGEGGSAGEERPVRAVEVSAGRLHTCALLENGNVKCWGFNNDGQLGQDHRNDLGDAPNELGDTLPPVNLGAGRTATRVVAGSDHTCVILDNGGLKCWGHGSFGQLGIGSETSRGDNAGEMAMLPEANLGAGRTAVALGTNGDHTCVVLDDDRIKCWGHNGDGRLGLGIPSGTVGNVPGETPDQLAAVDMGGIAALEVTTGTAHTAALLVDRSVRCWGYNVYGELGLGMGPPRGGDPSDMGANLPPIPLGGNALGVALGGNHSCALLEGGTVKCWGSNTRGELGLGVPNTPAYMPTNAANLGAGVTAVAIDLGEAFTCAVLATKRAKCWGDNTNGQLGLGTDEIFIGTDMAQMGDALAPLSLGGDERVLDLSAGYRHACAVLETTGAVKCWGANGEGQLGVGDVQSRGLSPEDMGDNLEVVDLGTIR